jgi:peptide/nickel transport system permease protein
MSQYLSEHEPQSEPAVGYRQRGKLTTLTLGATLVAVLILTALLAPWAGPFRP